MIKIGIDPSGTGTTGINVFLYRKLIILDEIKQKCWKTHLDQIIECIKGIFIKYENNNYNIFIENCLYTNANGSKDRDDLLRLLGALEQKLNELQIKFNWVSPRHTKSVVKNMENLSKYNDSCLWKFDKDINLIYQYGKGWFYNNEKISNHLRDAIIIANYER